MASLLAPLPLAGSGRQALPATCPISPTTDGCKVENPEAFEGWAFQFCKTRTVHKIVRLALLGILNFAATCGRQNWEVFGLSSSILFPK